ncbi:MAG: alpha-2-macroglobulin family protein [Anaerolineae bacterium]|nr:alpha-2-macroglobulin family protein [Anaerolineae bacterium]
MPRIIITPAVTAADSYTYWVGGVLHLSWQKTPRTRYCVQVRPGVLDRYGNASTTALSGCFTTGDESPFFSPATTLELLTFDATAEPLFYFLTRNISRADFRLGTLSERNFISGDGATERQNRSWSQTYRTDPNAVSVAPVTLTARGAPLPTGFYRLDWDVAENSMWRTNLRFAVVDRHVTLKLAQDEALVWVTDLRTGVSVPAVEVRLLDDTATLLGAGVTDADGLVRIRINPLEHLWNRVIAIVGAPGAPGFGVSLSDWDQGASPWDFDVSVSYSAFNPYRLYLYSDRPIYRPGQTVLVRGILREEDDVHYTLPDAGQAVTLALRDPDWQVVLTKTVALSDLGAFDAALELPSAARVGAYAVEATLPDAGVGPFGPWSWDLPLDVAAYRKPDFEVTVLPERMDLLAGEQARALVEATYYFGAPVANARVTWTLYPELAEFHPLVAGTWSWGVGAAGVFREPVASGEALTDAQGHWLLDWPAVLTPAEGQTETTAQRWVLEVTVVDESGFPVSGRGAFTVHPAHFYLGLQPRTALLLPGEPATVDLLALDWEGAGVAGQAVAATLVQRTWIERPAPQSYGGATWTYTDTVISTFEVQTGVDGAAEIVVTAPKGGAYVLIAEALDASAPQAPLVRSETYLWVSGPEGAAWRLPEGQVVPVADAASYRPGDVAQLFLPTPFQPPFEVLMTVERGGILQVQRFAVAEANPIITLPVEEGFAPNVYVSFVLVKAASESGASESRPPDVRVGYINLTVEPVAQQLTVELVPAQASPYAPGAEVPLIIRTRDAAGRGVDAEVGLALVDKAVLALAEARASSITEAFYGERSLSVRTGDSLLTLFNRLAASLAEVAEDADQLVTQLSAGGLGGGGDGALAPVELRQDFPDTAFWEAHLRTGPTGEAQLTVPLPDSLTTWVVDARAVTVDTRVGQAQAEWVVSKPLLVRPVTPRFFIAGDRLEVAAVVHNNTGLPLELTVRLDVGGAVSLEGEAAQQVTLPAGERLRVPWRISVTQGGDTARLIFSAEGGGYSDSAIPSLAQAPEGALPVYRYQSPDVLGLSGVLDAAGSRMETVFVPEGAGAATRLDVRLEPSLAASMASGLTAVEGGRNESTEMLVSRFLLNVLNYRALSSAGISAPELESRLQLLVPDALDRLYGRQLADGGWTWGAGTPADLQLSAYVALGFLEAQRAGFTVRSGALAATLDYLEQVILDESLRVPREWTPNHALTVYVLAEAGRLRSGGAGEALFGAREQLGITGQAYLALALGMVAPEDAKVTTLLETLRGAAERSATGARWEEQDSRYWVTDVRATAVTLAALARLAPDDPLIPDAVRWLLVARRGDCWATTPETAWSLLALTDVLTATGALRADYEWGVAFNGNALGSGTVNAATLRQTQHWQLTLDAAAGTSLLPGQVNALEIARGEGAGRLSYTAHLVLDLPTATLPADSRGIALQRAYCQVTDPSLPVDGTRPCVPVETVRTGDLVDVHLTVIVPKTRYFLTLEDFYPAGLEAVNPELLTERQAQDPSAAAVGAAGGGRWNPFERADLLDERAVFFSRALPAGTYQVAYRLRAVLAGEFQALPAVASETYFPEVWGRTAGAMLTVQP